MRYEVISAERQNDNEYTLLLEREAGKHKYRVALSFTGRWQHETPTFSTEGPWFINDSKLVQAQKFLVGFQYLTTEPGTMRSQVPQTLDHMSETLLLSLPVEGTRELFVETMRTWVEMTLCPAVVQTIEHPGYPLVALLFNPTIMAEETMRAMCDEVLRSIAHAEWERVEPAEDDSNDKRLPVEEEIDEDGAVEYVLDKEMETRLAQSQEANHSFAPLDMDTGEVIDGEGLAAADEELAAGGVGRVVPYKTMFSLKREWTPVLALYARAVQDQTISLFRALPVSWIGDNHSLLGMWCFSTPEAAYRSTLGTHAQNYTDEDIRQLVPNFGDFVQMVEVEGCIGIIEDNRAGTLVVKQREEN